MEMKLKIEQIEHHRNGVSGASFEVVKFRDLKAKANLIGIVFPEHHHVAVFDLDLLAKGEIRFFHNSWRGDIFEMSLRNAIVEKYK